MVKLLPRGCDLDIDPRPFMPGDRVMVWCVDPMRKDVAGSGFQLPATIVCRYGCKVINSYDICNAVVFGMTIPEDCDYRYYPDLVDVQFDHCRGISKGHFTKGIEYAIH